MKLSVVMKITVVDTPNVENVIDIDRFSNLNKLHRVTAYVLRFIRNLMLRIIVLLYIC